MGIEKLSNLIAHRLSEALHYTEEQTAVMAYGFFALLQTFLSIGIIIVISLPLGVVSESLIISFSIALLRKFSGGAHASSAERCLIIGTFITMLGTLFSYWISSTVTFSRLCYIIIFLFIWCFYIIFKKAPVASPQKPIISIHKQKKLKRGALIMLLCYLVCVLAFIYIYSHKREPIFLVYSICLTLGMSWQVFTITSVGYMIANCMDQVLIYISTIIKNINLKRRNEL